MKPIPEPSARYFEAKLRIPLARFLRDLDLIDEIPTAGEPVRCPNEARHRGEIEGPTLRIRDNGLGQRIYYCERCGLFGDHADALALAVSIRDPERKTKMSRAAAVDRVIEMAEKS